MANVEKKLLLIITAGIPRDSQCQYLIKCVGDQLCRYVTTVKPLITDPPKTGQPLYSRQLTCPQLILP